MGGNYATSCRKKASCRVTEITQDNIFDFHKPTALLAWKNVKIMRIREIKFNCADAIKIKQQHYDIDFLS